MPENTNPSESVAMQIITAANAVQSSIYREGSIFFGVPVPVLKNSIANTFYGAATIFSALNNVTGYSPLSYVAIGCFSLGCANHLEACVLQYYNENSAGNSPKEFTQSVFASAVSGVGSGLSVFGNLTPAIGTSLTLLGSALGKCAFDSARQRQSLRQRQSANNPEAALPAVANAEDAPLIIHTRPAPRPVAQNIIAIHPTGLYNSDGHVILALEVTTSRQTPSDQILSGSTDGQMRSAATIPAETNNPNTSPIGRMRSDSTRSR